MWIVLTEIAASVLRQQFEVLANRLSTVLFRVIVRTMILLAFLLLFARVDLIVSRVVLLFFPSVTVFASVLIGAAIRI